MNDKTTPTPVSATTDAGEARRSWYFLRTDGGVASDIYCGTRLICEGLHHKHANQICDAHNAALSATDAAEDKVWRNLFRAAKEMLAVANYTKQVRANDNLAPSNEEVRSWTYSIDEAEKQLDAARSQPLQPEKDSL